MSSSKLESTGTCQAPSSFYPNLLLVPGRFELGIGRKFFTERCGQGSGQAAREVRQWHWQPWGCSGDVCARCLGTRVGGGFVVAEWLDVRIMKVFYKFLFCLAGFVLFFVFLSDSRAS